MSQLSNTDQHADPAIDNQAEDQLTLRALVTTKEAGVVIGKGKYSVCVKSYLWMGSVVVIGQVILMMCIQFSRQERGGIKRLHRCQGWSVQGRPRCP